MSDTASDTLVRRGRAGEVIVGVHITGIDHDRVR